MMKRFLSVLIMSLGLCGAMAQGSGERILLIGDSMLDGLCRRLQDYADANGHYLRTFIWYGATTRHWATTKDMAYQIAKERPTLIVFSCGSNDLGYYDLQRREGYVKDIIAKFGKVPYVWVGPTMLRGVKDNGIGSIIRRNTGENHFFDTTKVNLVRGKDGIHPTFASAAQWMDKIVEWMKGNGYQIKLDKPTKKSTLRNYETHNPKYKGMQ
ncbi:MAG: SGNH/GDSL hydrolase family protein [Prevotella sp.]|nr:SGNH/GDSL hydrolase family protein [Prevotella sp.]